jgi:methylase of polypeptide subunit release factors
MCCETAGSKPEFPIELAQKERMQSIQRCYLYERNGVESFLNLDLEVDMTVGIGGDTWPAAELFCALILSKEWKPFFHSLFDQKEIIELGSGHGMVSIVIDQVFDRPNVCISDLPEYETLIKRNLERNQSKNCRMKPMDWTKIHEFNGNRYDIILALEW